MKKLILIGLILIECTEHSKKLEIDMDNDPRFQYIHSKNLNMCFLYFFGYHVGALTAIPCDSIQLFGEN